MTEGETGSCSDEQGVLSKSLIQISVEGWSCVPSLLFTWGGANEDNSDLPPKIPCMYCYTQCPQPCSRPPPTHASAGDSWTLPGKPRSVSCGVTAPFFCILVHTRFCLCPPGVFSPVLCQFWQLCGGINGDHSKRVYAIPKSAAPRAPALAAVHC